MRSVPQMDSGASRCTGNAGDLPGAIACLLLVRRLARRVFGLRLRTIAVVLSPLGMLLVFFLLGNFYPLAFALPTAPSSAFQSPIASPCRTPSPPSTFRNERHGFSRS
jgi:hypothetical protein